MTYSYLRQFAALPPSALSRNDRDSIRPRVLELTYTSHAMKPWAEDLGYTGSPFSWDEDRRAHLQAELDVFFARKYGLTEEELRYVLDPAKARGADCPSEFFRVLKERKSASTTNLEPSACCSRPGNGLSYVPPYIMTSLGLAVMGPRAWRSGKPSGPAARCLDRFGAHAPRDDGSCIRAAGIIPFPVN